MSKTVFIINTQHGKRKLFSSPGKAEFEVTTTGDGFSPAWEIPYFVQIPETIHIDFYPVGTLIVTCPYPEFGWELAIPLKDRVESSIKNNKVAILWLKSQKMALIILCMSQLIGVIWYFFALVVLVIAMINQPDLINEKNKKLLVLYGLSLPVCHFGLFGTARLYGELEDEDNDSQPKKSRLVTQ